MWEVEKKVGKKKSEIEEKFNQKTLFDGSGASKIISLTAKMSWKYTVFGISHTTNSYFYDIEILCEKQSYFHCVPLGKKRLLY